MPRSISIGPRIGPGIGTGSAGGSDTGLQILVIEGQSNGNGFAFTANQIAVPNISFAYPAVQQVDHLATINGDPLVYTFDRLTPVSLSPRIGDANGDSSVELSLMRRLDRAQPGRWAVGKMCIPSSSMLNWIAVGSTYPTLPPQLIDQWLAYLTYLETTLSGRIVGIVDHQGESDCQTGPLSAAFGVRKTGLINATRTHLGRTVPFYLAKMHTGAGGTGNATVRAAQVAIAAALPRVTVVDLDSLAIATLHYTDDQYALAGVIEARAIMTDLGINDPPFAQFSWAWTGTSVTFTDASTAGSGNTIVGRLWNFGDGSTSIDTNPVHVYGALGTYTVTETVTDSRGGTNTMTRLVACAAGNWTVDTLSGRAVPVDATEVAALFTAAGLAFSPTSMYLPGAPAATPILDAVGAFPLTVAGASVEFQSTVPGWTTKGLRTINNVTDGASTTDAALPDVLTTSCLAIVQVAAWTTPTATRGIIAMGTTETQISISNANPPRLLARSNTQTATGTVGVNNDVHLHMLRHNRTASTCKVITDVEPPITVTFAGSVTGKRFRFGLTSSSSPGAQFVHVMRIDGANAELSDAQCKTLGSVMGYVMP